MRRARWMAASGAEIHAHELDDRGGGFSADSTDSRGDDAGGGYHDAELSRGAETRVPSRARANSSARARDVAARRREKE